MRLILISILIVLFSFSLLGQNPFEIPMENVRLENLDITYSDQALYFSWSVPDSVVGASTGFLTFYVEIETKWPNWQQLIDNELNWYMSYDQCWEWQRNTFWKYEGHERPNHVWPPYTSMIRMGVMPIREMNMGTDSSYVEHGLLHLFPDIVNKTPQTPSSDFSIQP